MTVQTKVITTTDRWLSGTHEERLVYDMSKENHLRSKIMFIEEDTGSTFEWTGLMWISTSVKGATNIHDADVHNQVVNEFFHRHVGINTTLQAPALINTSFIDVADATGLVVGQELQIISAMYGTLTTFITIVGIIGTGIYLDHPLDFPLYIGDTVEVVSIDFAVVGTKANPVSFKLFPHTNSDIWHITSFILSMQHSSTGDDSLFGNLTTLTNGCILRIYDPIENLYGTLTHWHNNSDLRMDMAVVDYTSKAGGGNHTTSADGRMRDRTGAVPVLAGASMYLELLIQDDLSALVLGRLKGQGHVVGK